MKKTILIILCLQLVSWMTAQVSFTASSSTSEAAIGAIFEVKFSLKNELGDDFKAPSFADFNVVGGPNQMSSAHIVNGVATRTFTYSYQLQAKKEGKYVIGAAKVRCKGKYLESQPLTIIVSKVPTPYSTQARVPLDAKEAVFVRAEISSTEARVGQQLVLDYKLYTRVSLSGVNLLKEADYDGFYKQDVNSYNHGESRIKLGGKDYTSKILQRVVLFPQKEGERTILPLVLQVGIVTSSGDPLDDFFRMGATTQKTIQSNPVTINVAALPANPPASFTGGVGTFEASASLSRTEATTDDILSLKLTVLGTGDPKQWQAPKWAAVEGLEFYEPKMLSERPNDGAGTIETTKEWEYLVVPKKAGTFELKPAFTYFDLKKNEYVTLQPQTYQLNITQGTNVAAKASMTAAPQQKDIRFIQMNTHLKGINDVFFNSIGYYVLLLLPFLVGIAAYFYKLRQAKLANRDMSLLKSQNAQKVAQKRLAVAAEHLQQGRKRAFFDETSKAMFSYINDKLNIEMAQFSKTVIREKLEGLKVPVYDIERYLKVLQRCEMALFANSDGDDFVQETYKEALSVITEIENRLTKGI